MLCASAMASSAQTMTSANSAKTPISLRRRSGIAAIHPFRLSGQRRDYRVRRVQAIPYTVEASVAPPAADFRRRAIRVWLLAAAALVFITLLVGGATRLTESG